MTKKPTHTNGNGQQTPLKFPERKPLEIRQRFATWLALPTKERKPLLKQDLAAELGVHIDTLITWQKDETFANEVRFAICNNELSYAPDVAQVIRNRALGKTDAGSAKHAELHLRHLSRIWNDSNSLSLLGIVTAQEDMLDLLQTGRLGEQIQGMVASLQRQEDREIEAEYEVLDNVTDESGDTDTEHNT